jgi:hypothetical protein
VLAALYPSERRSRRLYVLQLLQQHVEDKGSGEGEASDDYCHVGGRRGDEVALRDCASVAEELHSPQYQRQASQSGKADAEQRGGAEGSHLYGRSGHQRARPLDYEPDRDQGDPRPHPREEGALVGEVVSHVALAS